MGIFDSILGALGSQGSSQIDKSQLPSGPQSLLPTEGQQDTPAGGLWDQIQQGLSGKGNLMSIVADTVGQRLNPTGSNVMGGLGTAFAKSDMASKKMEADKAEYKDLLSNVLDDLRSGSDMNRVGMNRDPMTGEIKVDTQTKIPRKIDDIVPQKESSADASSAVSNQKAGSMQDMMTMYQ